MSERPYFRCRLCLLIVPFVLSNRDPRAAECMWCGNTCEAATAEFVEPTIFDRFRVDPLMPEGVIMACEMVVAERDGKTFDPLPPSAVMERGRVRRKG